jgi:hypothetical protein
LSRPKSTLKGIAKIIKLRSDYKIENKSDCSLLTGIYLEDMTTEFQSAQPRWSEEKIRQMACVGRDYLVTGTAKHASAIFPGGS